MDALMDTMTFARYAFLTVRQMEARMVTRLYESPVLVELGSVRALTRQNPPGKNGLVHDGSQFQTNFSCVVTRDSNCAGGANP